MGTDGMLGIDSLRSQRVQLDLTNKPAPLLGMNAMLAFDRGSIDFESKKVRFVMPGTSMRRTFRLADAGGGQ